MGTVRERGVGARVHFDDNAVRARGNRGARHRCDLVAQTGAVARVGDDRQVRELLHQGNRREIEQIARHRVEAANAALAQNHALVAFGENVLGAHEQISDRRRHAALEQDRLADAAGGTQQ